jgi:hypothetical protein
MSQSSLRKLFNSLPEWQKSRLAKVNFMIQGKPKNLNTGFQGKRFPGSFKGGVIISADMEMGWAVRYSRQAKDPVEYANRERMNVPVILSLLENYEIPVTWSVVGHLLLEICSRGDHD